MTLEIITDPTLIYLALAIGSLTLLILYQREYSADAVVDFFIYLTNKFTLFIIGITFIFCFVFSIIYNNNSSIITFFQNVFKGILYYIFFSYALFYGLKLIDWTRNFFKEQDLLNVKFFKKLEKQAGKIKK